MPQTTPSVALSAGEHDSFDGLDHPTLSHGYTYRSGVVSEREERREKERKSERERRKRGGESKFN